MRQGVLDPPLKLRRGDQRGIKDSAPYLHDGRGANLQKSVPETHFGGREAARRNRVHCYWVVGPVIEARLGGSNYGPKARLSGSEDLETPLLPTWRIRIRDLFWD